MDELEISGKRYLSSRRAAKEHHYHADYIGQLIRGGKVVGTKVGRAWYVEADSLATYLAAEASGSAVSTHREPSVQGSVPSVRVLSQTQVHIPTLSKEQSFSLTVKKAEPEKEPAPVTVNTLRYVADDQPLFPVVQKKTQIYEQRDFFHTMPRSAAPASVRHYPAVQKKSLPKTAVFAGVLLLGGVTFGLVLFTSAKLFARVVVEQGQPASVGYTF